MFRDLSSESDSDKSESNIHFMLGKRPKHWLRLFHHFLSHKKHTSIQKKIKYLKRAKTLNI